MKHPSFLLLLSVFLTSCGQEVVPPTPSPVSQTKTEVSAPVAETSKEAILSDSGIAESNSGNIIKTKNVCTSEHEMNSLKTKINVLNKEGGRGFFQDEEMVIDFGKYSYTSFTGGERGGIHFGPYLLDGGPCVFEISQMYTFEKTQHRSKDEIIQAINKLKYENGDGNKFKETLKINNFEVVVWEEFGGYPTYTQNFEIVGKNQNYLFSTHPLYQDKKAEDYKFIIAVINSLKISDNKNEASFSDTQIQDILAKIDANTKAQQEVAKNATGVLVQGDYRAEYVSNNFDVSKADSIIVTKNGIQKSISGIYKPIADGSHFSFISKFMEFSPSGNYLLYETPCEAQCPSGLINTENGEVVLRFTNINYHEWTLDRKRFIYAEPTARDMTLQLSITVRGAFPKAKTLIEKGFLDATIEGNFLYARTLYKTTEDGSMLLKDSDKKKFLHIFDLTTDKEVFSKEIPN